MLFLLALQFEIAKCHFLVDRDNEHKDTSLEPRYIVDNNTWTVVHRYPFLDAERYTMTVRLCCYMLCMYFYRSHGLLRSFYFPYVSEMCNTYVDYFLLANKVLIRM